MEWCKGVRSDVEWCEGVGVEQTGGSWACRHPFALGAERGALGGLLDAGAVVVDMPGVLVKGARPKREGGREKEEREEGRDKGRRAGGRERRRELGREEGGRGRRSVGGYVYNSMYLFLGIFCLL